MANEQLDEQKNNKQQSSKLLPRILVTLAFFIGLGIFLYPTLSNYLLVRSQTLVVKDYEEKVKKVIPAEKDKLKKQAAEYNKAQTNNTPELGDTFAGKDPSATPTTPNAVDDEGNAIFDVMKSMLGPALATIEIPKINLESPIYRGTSEELLQKGIGWLEGSSLPTGGIGTHAVLTGHRGLPTAKLFTDLPELEKGDQFIITYLDEKLAYEVNQILTVEPDETDALVINPTQDYITLITCTPYMINSHRLFVRGHRVPYINEAKKLTLAENIRKYFNWYSLAGFLMIMIITLIWLYNYYKKRKLK